jgi:hypothetical protein
VIDSFERDFYFGDIREALEHLSKYYQWILWILWFNYFFLN